MGKRTLLLAGFGALIVAANLGMLMADAQVAEEPGAPPPPVAAEPAPEASVADPPEEGMSVTVQDDRTHAELGVTTVSVVSDSCASGEGADVRLGLMKHTAVYGHCD